MKDNLTPFDKRQQPATTGGQKKLYQKPAFRHERVFETLALSCGKAVASIAQCQFSTKTS
ncbi:MAG: hypothetical protein WBQ43_07450 [Terriglobales bacterium]